MKAIFSRKAILVALAAAAVILFAVSRSVSRQPLNLVLISIDTLRADRLSVYGHHRDTSPAISKFAESAIVFEHTVSVSPWTLPSHVTMFSGLYPTSHGVTLPTLAIGKDTPLLAEILSRNGYRTFGLTGGGNIGKRYGFARGFDQYRSRERHEKKNLTGFPSSVARAKELLSTVTGEPYFLFVHTYDTHCPYTPPEPYFSMYNSAGSEAIDPTQCGDSVYRTVGGVSEAQAKYLSDRYDGSVRWADRNFRDLLEFLQSREDYNRTVVIITSDHGEEFAEHGRIGHHHSLHRELLMIPLIISVPDRTGRRVSTAVSLVDLFPTMLELLDIEQVPSDGRSLKGLIAGDESSTVADTPKLSELHRDVRMNSYMNTENHLIVDEDKGEKKFYDIAADPREATDIASKNPEIVASWAAEMKEFIGSLGRRESGSASKSSPEEVERLKTLGYIQ